MDYKQLRKTPGYTNYVVGVNKNIGGAISSAILKRYYSSLDANIYINGQWIEDIASIQWTINQQTMPLYGYNSYVFDDVAQGSRIIQGDFILVFTSPNAVENIINIPNGSNYVDGEINTNNGGSYEEEEKYIIDSESISANVNTGKIKVNNQHLNIWNSKFDIDIVCGEKESVGGLPCHIVLKNCYVTNSRQVRDGNAGTAVEACSFLAQDFVTIE